MFKKNLIELCLSPDLGGLELYMVRSAKALVDDFNVIRTEFYPSDEDVIVNYSGRVIDYLDKHFHNTSWEEDCLTCKRKPKYQNLYP